MSTDTTPSHTKRLRILEVVHGFPPFRQAGTELYTLHLAQAFQRLGHEVTVLHPVRDPKRLQLQFKRAVVDGVTVFRINTLGLDSTPAAEFLNPALDQPFADFLGGQAFDLVHFQHLIGLSVHWPEIARQRGLKTVLKVDDMFYYCRRVHLTHRDGSACSGPESLDKCHDCTLAGCGPAPAEDVASGFHLLAYRRTLLREVFAGFDFVHTPTRFLERTHRQFGFDNRHLEVLPTGIQPFAVLPKVPDPGGRLRVSFLGNLERRKGILVFLRAIDLYQARLRESKGRPALRFAMQGGHFKDGLSREVLRRVEQLADTEYRGGFGPEDRGRIFAAADLIAVPSIGENYPFVIREALFAGVPVVATAIAGVPEIIAPGRNGFLVPPGDAEALAAVFWALQEDAGLLGRLNPAASRPVTIDEDAAALSRRFMDLVG